MCSNLKNQLKLRLRNFVSASLHLTITRRYEKDIHNEMSQSFKLTLFILK